MLVYALRERIPCRWWVVVASFAALAATVALGCGEQLGPVPLAVLLLSLGALLPVRAGSRNDISYGVYIYAFPVQQLLVVAAGTDWPVWWHSVCALAITAMLAWASWRWVESPALRWKSVVR